MTTEKKITPTLRIVTPEGLNHGKNTKVYDDQGRDISHLFRTVVVELDVNKTNMAWLQAPVSVDVQALPEVIAILQKCPDCLVQSPLTDATAFGDKARKYAGTPRQTDDTRVRFTTEPINPSTDEIEPALSLSEAVDIFSNK